MPKRSRLKTDFVTRRQYGVPPHEAVTHIADTIPSGKIEL